MCSSDLFPSHDMSLLLIFQEVINNSETQGDGNTQVLGTLAGKGALSNKHRGGKVVVKVDEVEKLLQEQREVTEDEVPEPPAEPITKPGDLWILGNHRLLCGDSTKVEDVERLMAGAKVDLCFTSPPYNAGIVITDGKHAKKYQDIDDKQDADGYLKFLQGFF